MRPLTVLIALSISLLTTTASLAKTTLIHCGTLIDVPGDVPKHNQSILVVDNTIVSIPDGFTLRHDRFKKLAPSVLKSNHRPRASFDRNQSLGA